MTIEMKKIEHWYLSNSMCTIYSKTEDGVVVETAPIARKYIGWKLDDFIRKWRFDIVEKILATTVVHCKKSKYDVYIGRPSKWGNPFEIGKDGDRNEVVRKYAEWILDQPELLKALPELKGKILGCWCFPNLCHGDVLVELVNEINI